jgi:hypothetical protein
MDYPRSVQRIGDHYSHQNATTNNKHFFYSIDGQKKSERSFEEKRKKLNATIQVDKQTPPAIIIADCESLSISIFSIFSQDLLLLQQDALLLYPLLLLCRSA